MDFRADQGIETRIGKVTFYRPDYVSGQIVRAIKRSNFGQEALEINEQLGYYMDKYAANPTDGFGELTIEVRRAWGVEATVYVHCRPDYEAHLLTDELKMQLYPVKFEVEVNAGSTIRSASAARAFAALMGEAADLACLLEAIAASSKLLAIMRPERKEE